MYHGSGELVKGNVRLTAGWIDGIACASLIVRQGIRQESGRMALAGVRAGMAGQYWIGQGWPAMGDNGRTGIKRGKGSRMTAERRTEALCGRVRMRVQAGYLYDLIWSV